MYAEATNFMACCFYHETYRRRIVGNNMRGVESEFVELLGNYSPYQVKPAGLPAKKLDLIFVK